MVQRCSWNNLELNALKTVEMIVDLRKRPQCFQWKPSRFWDPLFPRTTVIRKGPAEDELPVPAQEVRPASGSAGAILHSNNSVCPLHLHRCLTNMTGTDYTEQSGLQRKSLSQTALDSGHTHTHTSRIRRHHCRPSSLWAQPVCTARL